MKSSGHLIFTLPLSDFDHRVCSALEDIIFVEHANERDGEPDCAAEQQHGGPEEAALHPRAPVPPTDLLDLQVHRGGRRQSRSCRAKQAFSTLLSNIRMLHLL